MLPSPSNIKQKSRWKRNNGITQAKLEEANRSLVYGSTLDINGQTQDRKRIQGLDRNPMLPSLSNIKQKSRLKRNNGFTQTKLEEANRSLVYGSTLDINGQTQDRKRIHGLDRNPMLPSPSNTKQKSRLKRNNGFTQSKPEEANRSLVYGSTLDINGQTQDRKRIQELDRNPMLPSPSNIKQKSRLKRNNGIQRLYLNFRESFPTKIYIWHLSDVRFKKTLITKKSTT